MCRSHCEDMQCSVVGNLYIDGLSRILGVMNVVQVVMIVYDNQK